MGWLVGWYVCWICSDDSFSFFLFSFSSNSRLGVDDSSVGTLGTTLNSRRTCHSHFFHILIIIIIAIPFPFAALSLSSSSFFLLFFLSFCLSVFLSLSFSSPNRTRNSLKVVYLSLLLLFAAFCCPSSSYLAVLPPTCNTLHIHMYIRLRPGNVYILLVVVVVVVVVAACCMVSWYP